MDPGLALAIFVGITGGVVWGGIMGAFVRGLLNALDKDEAVSRGRTEDSRAGRPEIIVVSVPEPPRPPQPGPLWQNHRIWEMEYERPRRYRTADFLGNLPRVAGLLARREPEDPFLGVRETEDWVHQGGGRLRR